MVPAYLKFVSIYQAFGTMDITLFQELVEPSNVVAWILLANFIAIQMIMAPILDQECSDQGDATVRSHLSWVSRIYHGTPLHLRHYMEWPMAVSDNVTLDIKKRHNEGLDRRGFEENGDSGL